MRQLLLWAGLFLIAAGGVALLVALAWPGVQKLGLGRLPGDIVIRRDGFRFYFPLTTCILLSALASVLLWLIVRAGPS